VKERKATREGGMSVFDAAKGVWLDRYVFLLSGGRCRVSGASRFAPRCLLDCAFVRCRRLVLCGVGRSGFCGSDFFGHIFLGNFNSRSLRNKIGSPDHSQTY
jgi:hypothetical protein